MRLMKFGFGVALAGTLAGCATGSTGGPAGGAQTTLNDVRSQIAAACGFVTTNQDIFKVARTLGAAANPALGVTLGVADSTVTSICDAWTAAKAAKKESTSGAIRVNGVIIHGHALK